MFNLFRRRKNPQETLSTQIKSTLPEGMHLPDALEKLFDWIESNGFVSKRNALRCGRLMDIESSEIDLAPDLEFSAEGSLNHKYWFCRESEDISDRFYTFCRTGGDGSMGAFWLDDNGHQHIVHMGSGSGSTLVCVLTDNAVDFLRLLAIGYEEICWGEFDTPPDEDVTPNAIFRSWVETEFSVTIPRTGKEIVGDTAELGDEDHNSDPFLQWVAPMVDF